MIFHSFDYIIFFLLVFLLYWNSNHKFQNIILLVSSYIFYSYIHPWFFGLIFFQTFISFQAAKIIPRTKNYSWLIAFLAISSNLIVLGYFKYYNFFVENIISIFNLLNINSSFTTLEILLPVGISFYTFQNIGYIVDVYRKKMDPCYVATNYFVFVSFFPQLVAGPIERAQNLLPQIENERKFSRKTFVDGFLLIIWGFFKKLVIADNVALICNKTYLLSEPDPFLMIVGTLAFCVQIYADFSAYTDIARGTAKMLGFHLIKNFNNPYFSRNASDFWRRWHMSLSQWIRDYIYIPLGGSRCSVPRWVFNISFTFLLIGLWHGATWNFIIWGLYYAILTIIYKVWEKLVPTYIYNLRYNWILSIPTMFIFTSFGWMIFRETNLNYLIKYLSMNFTLSDTTNFFISIYLMLNLLIYSLPIIITSTYTFINENKKKNKYYNVKIIESVKIFNAVFLYLLILIFHSSSSIDFIYFQF